MENKNIIIIMIAVILVLAAVLGVMFFQSANAKEPTGIEIRQTNRTVDDNFFSVKVTDSKGNQLVDAAVNLTIKDAKGKAIVDEEVKIDLSNSSLFDFDLKKGKYVVDVDYNGNKDYSPSHGSYNLNVDAVTATDSAEEIKAMEYTEHSPTFGNYRIIESQQELGVIETSNGEYFVLAGDGYYTYGGHDSNGNIKLGSYVGKYNM